jgi:two-component system, NtrC family, response regulator AtoC
MAEARALVVDDDDPIRTMLATLVGREGFVVDTAKDGAEAIAKINKGDFGLILLDLMMPGVDGYTVLRHLRINRPDLVGCTIIASAVPEMEILARIGEPVFKIHIKPFDMSRLISDVRSCRAA